MWYVLTLTFGVVGLCIATAIMVEFVLWEYRREKN